MRAGGGPTRTTLEKWKTPGPWERTPWWVFWRPRWRRERAPISIVTGAFGSNYDFATDADFLTMDAQ